MSNKLSDSMNQLIADKYPEYADKLNSALGVTPAKPTQEVNQLSLDPKVTIHDNLNKLVDAINNPDTKAEDRIKALSSYNMIIKQMQGK